MNRFARIRWMMRNSQPAPLLARLPQKVRHSIDQAAEGQSFQRIDPCFSQNFGNHRPTSALIVSTAHSLC
jgi:hypothetical protein